MSGKFGQHDVREQVPVFAFLQCGLTNSKLAVLVAQYAQVGLEKDKILKGQFGKTVNAAHIDPSDYPPSIPNFTYPTQQIVWFWVPASITSYKICSTVTLWVGTDACFLCESGLSSSMMMMMLKRFKSWSSKQKLLYPCMTLFIHERLSHENKV